MSETVMAMRMVKLPANMRWAVIFGDSLVPIEGRTLWPDPEGLQEALEAKGLKVVADGTIQNINSEG